MPRGATRWPTRGGVFVAVVGFVLTWYTVVDSLRPDVSLVAFLVGQAPALVAGFGLTTFGVGLAVSSRDRADADVVAQWCAAGTLSMAAVVVMTYVGAGIALPAAMESRLVANVLVGGAVGGTLTGVRSVATRRHRREVARKADRLTVLNRLLRHEVLNKVNVVEGYAADESDAADSLSVIRRNAAAIGETVDRVGALTGRQTPEPVDLADCVADAVGAVRERHPDATVETGTWQSVTVRGTPQFDDLFDHLIESAVIRGDGDARVRVAVENGADGAEVRVATDGTELSPAEERIVEGRATPERDDPRSGFGLSVARLLAEEVEGSLHAETADGETTLVVSLPRAGEAVGFGATPTRLRHAALAALVAGGAMGLLVQFVSGQMPVIGALYGVENVAVGWVTHLFHSVCFGFWFVAATATWADDDPRTLGALGAGYGVALWLVAAGLVMPLWLRALGMPAPVPNLALPSLVSHLVWGAVFGGLYGWLCRRA